MFSPPRRSKFHLIQQDAPRIHRVAAVTGGLNDIYRRIKYNTTPHQALESQHGRYTSDNILSPQPGMPLLASRYRFLRILGGGQSSIFIKVEDTFQAGVIRAVKVLHTNYRSLGVQESDCIRRLNLADPYYTAPTLRLCNIFMFHGHYCMVFEILAPDPLTYYFRDLPQNMLIPCIRKVAFYLLKALGFLQTHNIIHADLKPANILLEKENEFSTLKVVDFGNSIRCVNEEISLYFCDFELQTLLYRAPEVVYGLQFGLEVDMWSLGCVLGELFINRPLFQGRNKLEVLEDMTDLLGPLPYDIFRRGKYYSELQHFTNSSADQYAATTPELMAKLECRDYAFVDFLRLLLQYNPHDRLTVSDAARHPFLAGEIILRKPGETKATSVLIDHLNYTKRPFVEDAIQRQAQESIDLLHTGTTREYRINKNKSSGELGRLLEVQERSWNCRFPTPKVVVLERRASPVQKESSEPEGFKFPGRQAARGRVRVIHDEIQTSASASETETKVVITSQRTRNVQTSTKSLGGPESGKLIAGSPQTSRRNAHRKHSEKYEKLTPEEREPKPLIEGMEKKVPKSENYFTNRYEYERSDHLSSPVDSGYHSTTSTIQPSQSSREVFPDAGRSSTVTAGKLKPDANSGKRRKSLGVAARDINTTYQVKEEQKSEEEEEEEEENERSYETGKRAPTARWKYDTTPTERAVKPPKIPTSKNLRKVKAQKLAMVGPFVMEEADSKRARVETEHEASVRNQENARQHLNERWEKSVVTDQNFNTITEDRNSSATNTFPQEGNLPAYHRQTREEEEDAFSTYSSPSLPHPRRASSRPFTQDPQESRLNRSLENQGKRLVLEDYDVDSSEGSSESLDESPQTKIRSEERGGSRRTADRHQSRSPARNTIAHLNSRFSPEQQYPTSVTPPLIQTSQIHANKRKRQEEEAEVKKKKLQRTHHSHSATARRNTAVSQIHQKQSLQSPVGATHTKVKRQNKQERKAAVTDYSEQSDTSYTSDESSPRREYRQTANVPDKKTNSRNRAVERRQCSDYSPEGATKQQHAPVRTPDVKSGRRKVGKSPKLPRTPNKSRISQTPKKKSGRSKADRSPSPYDEVLLL